MSILDDIGNFLGIGEPDQLMGGLTGREGANAALEGAISQANMGREGLALNDETLRRLEATLAPFVGVGTGQMGQASQLFGPNAMRSVSNDPAFQAGADKLTQQILAQQSVRGGRGDTATGLQSSLANFGSDYLSRQRGDFLGALGLGQASAAQQAAGGLQTGQRGSDLLTQIGNSYAAGGIGAANSLGQGASNVGGIASLIGGFFSDRRLKKNISKHGNWRGYNTYKYQYKDSDDWYIGVMSDEVKAVNPSAVTSKNGYDVVNYEAL